MEHESHRDGLDCVLKIELQAKQELLLLLWLEWDLVLGSTFLLLFPFSMKSLQAFIAKFFALDCSLNLTRMVLFTNQRALRVEFGMIWLLVLGLNGWNGEDEQ